MHSTVRTLRIALPIAFFLFVALLVAMYTSNARRASAARPTETSTLRGDDRPQLVTFEFEDTQTVAGRVVSKIQAQRMIGFSSGWYTLEGVEITIFRRSGQTYQIACPAAQFNATTKEAEAKGGVKVSSSDGLRIATDALVFDGNRMLNEIPVHFGIDLWSGTAGGVDLNVEHESVRLIRGIHATLAPQTPQEPPVQADAGEIVFYRGKGEVTLTEKVRATRATDRFEVDAMTARFAEDRNTLVGLEGFGNLLAKLGAPAAAMPAGEKSISGERFAAEMGPKGEIVAVNIIGDQRPAKALMPDVPPRELEARLIRIGLSAGVLTEIRADGNVSMIEKGPSNRRVTAGRVTVYFDRATRQALSGLLEMGVAFTDGKTEAVADRGNYDIAGDRVILTGTPTAVPSAKNELQSIRAARLELSPKDGMMRADGSVVAQLRSKPGASPDAGLFGGSGKAPIFVNSDSFVTRRSTRQSAFSGNVRAWQGENLLLANDVLITGAGEAIQATGKVRATLHNTKVQGRNAPLAAQAERLAARKESREVELEGQVVIEDDGRKLTADRATIYLDAAQKIERVEATGNVVLAEPATGRKATGSKAVYRLTQRMIHLDGTPAVLEDQRGTVKGTRIIFDLAKNRVDVASSSEATYNPR